ncbi:MAG TPA: ArsR family transcriptional regulator, partial [Dehalococcoidia bacterium]|nr:ArsR family transcriptional regulator [Dehalococcoidia bacterium]
AQFDLTRPAVSQHLKVLAQSGLVSVRRQGTQRLYKVRPEGLQELKQFLASFWEENLERLAAAAEAEERGTRLNVNK